MFPLIEKAPHCHEEKFQKYRKAQRRAQNRPVSYFLCPFLFIYSVVCVLLGFQVAQSCQAEDVGSIPGAGRSLREGNGNPL